MSKEIVHLTDKLLTYNRIFLKNYQEAREKNAKKDFYETIKPFADEVKAVNDAWRGEMRSLIKRGTFKHIHLRQVENTSEHIEQLSIQSFFPETSRTRFLNTNRTVEYFLLGVLNEVRH